MTIGKFPSWGLYDTDGTLKEYYRHPENDLEDMKKMPEQQRKKREYLLSLKRYEKDIKHYLGRKIWCKYDCHRNVRYDIDYFDDVIDCQRCGYHLNKVTLVLEDLGLIKEGDY